MDGNAIYQGLLNRGYGPVQAAALTGNILQESGGNPNAFNEKEGARGLLQWRQDRLTGLQDFARSRGVDPYDTNTQLDYIGSEFGGSEKRNAAPFLAAPDLNSANAALKGYIRYGDNSQGVRLANAQGILGQGGAAPMSIAGPPAAAGSAPAAPAPSDAPPAPPQQGGGYTIQGTGAPSITPNQIAQIAAVQGPQNILPARPNLFGLQTAPFSLRG